MAKPKADDYIEFRKAKLTKRHLQVLTSLRKGMYVKEVAVKYNMSPATLAVSLSVIRKNTKTRSNTELIAELVKNEIIY